MDYDFEEISLYGAGGKPDWFWKLNPAGTVPVLECAKGVVHADSDDILNAISEFPGGDKLEPPNEEVASAVKDWRRELNSNLLPVGKAYVQSRRKRDQLDAILKSLDDKVVGPYLCGETVTVADCAAFPFLWRLLNEDDFACPKLTKWLSQCESNPSFRKTIQSAWWWWW